MLDPAGMIDQFLKRLSALDHIMQFKTSLAGVITALGVSPPLANAEMGKLIKCLIEPARKSAPTAF